MGTDGESSCISWKQLPSLTSGAVNHPGYAVRNKTYNEDGGGITAKYWKQPKAIYERVVE